MGELGQIFLKIFGQFHLWKNPLKVRTNLLGGQWGEGHPANIELLLVSGEKTFQGGWRYLYSARADIGGSSTDEQWNVPA